MEAKILQAREASHNWLNFVDNCEYIASWFEAAPYFQNTITAQQWEQVLQSVRQPLGEVVSRAIDSQRYADSLPGAPNNEYVVIKYQTSFEYKKSAVETVTLMLAERELWRVTSYFIE